MNVESDPRISFGEDGKDHEKPFILCKPKTQEEIAREKLRKMLPEFRRDVNEKRIVAQAKWLFSAISDDTCLYEAGGDGFGTLITNIKDLSARYKHDRDSIGRWLDVLAESEAIWYEFKWPYFEIHLSAFIPPPSHKASAGQRIRARLSARKGRAEDTRTPLSLPKNGKSPRKTDENRETDPGISPGCAEDTRKCCPRDPQVLRELSADNGGRDPHVIPMGSASLAGDTRITCGTEPLSRAEDAGFAAKETSIATARKAPLENTPDKGVLETSKAVKRLANRKRLEERFLETVGVVLGKAELAKNGGLWITNFRTNTTRAEAVLAEVRVMKTQGQIKTSPAKAAVDLWKRWK